MREERGLALFCGLVVILIATVYGLPLFTLAERAKYFADGYWPEQRAAAQIFQYSRRASEIKPSLLEVLLTQRSFSSIEELARQNSIGETQLLSFLAVSAEGVYDSRGFFMAHPLGLEDGRGMSAAELSARAAAQFGEIKKKLGSFPAALLAWKAGLERAERSWGKQGERRISLFLSQPLLDEARDFLCRVETLRQGLEGFWLKGGKWSEKDGATIFSLPEGSEIASPLPGTVIWRRAGCVVVKHFCGVFSEFCGVRNAVRPGKSVRAGEPLAISTGEVRFVLLAGSHKLQPPQSSSK